MSYVNTVQECPSPAARSTRSGRASPSAAARARSATTTSSAGRRTSRSSTRGPSTPTPQAPSLSMATPGQRRHRWGLRRRQPRPLRHRLDQPRDGGRRRRHAQPGRRQLRTRTCAPRASTGGTLHPACSSGTVSLTGTLTNTGGTRSQRPATGSWIDLSGGTIDFGGTVTGTGAGVVGLSLGATNQGGTLKGGARPSRRATRRSPISVVLDQSLARATTLTQCRHDQPGGAALTSACMPTSSTVAAS